MKKEEELKTILYDSKIKYGDSWEKIKDQLYGLLQRARDILLKEGDITKEDFDELNKVVGDFRQQLFNLWIWGSVKGTLEICVEFVNRPKFRELLRKAATIGTLEEAFGVKEILEEVIKMPQTKLVTTSTYLFIVNPKLFIPLYPNELREKMEVYGQSIEEYYNLLKNINKATNSQLPMIEAAYYLYKYETNELETTKPVGKIYNGNYISLYFASKGYLYPDYLVAQFYSALKTKGFIILLGLTGTGKTKMVQELAALLDSSKKNFLFISVRPDWRDSKPLIGYYNPLKGEKGGYQNTQLLDFIRQASEDYKNNRSMANPYFILLDEMNLAHVEYYLADFLSVLESGRDEDGFTREAIHLHDVDITETPKRLKLPPNLYIIGTVNMDETTYSFSPKVLDRAFTIELHKVELEKYPPAEATGSSPNFNGLREKILNDLRGNDGKFLAKSKQEINNAVNELKKMKPEYWSYLIKLNNLLEPYDLHFGYRVLDELALFFVNARDSKNKGIISFENDDEIIDLAILMKVLPKFHGPRRKLERPLMQIVNLSLKQNLTEESPSTQEDELFYESIEKLLNKITGKDISNAEKAFEEILLKWGEYKKKFRFPHTTNKCLRMLRQLNEIGFASFS